MKNYEVELCVTGPTTQEALDAAFDALEALEVIAPDVHALDYRATLSRQEAVITITVAAETATAAEARALDLTRVAFNSPANDHSSIDRRSAVPA
ncbi:MAG: hypothetical protein V9E98_07640 [Candidatus Nanopelagicales bacterium]